MAKKILGYILAIIGIAGVAVGTIPQIKTLLAVPIPAVISDLYLIIGGVVLLIIGILLSRSGKKRKSAEVPIYHGSNIVGYRRH